jgi:hypothetical protein
MNILSWIVFAFDINDSLNPWNISTGPWTNLFQRFVGNGNVFYLFPLIILTVGVYYKTDNPAVTSAFMMGSGSLLSFGTLSMGVPDLPIIFGLFTAMGLIPLFSFIIYGGE